MTAQKAEPIRRSRLVAMLVPLSALWLVGVLWAAYWTVTGNPGSDAVATAQAAIALPTVVAASMLAGTVAGMSALGRLAGRLATVESRSVESRSVETRSVETRSARLRAGATRVAVGSAAGTPIGLACAAAALGAYGTEPVVVSAATAIGLGAVCGGALAAIRPEPAVPAGLYGSLAVLVIGFLRGAFAGELISAIDSSHTIDSSLAANSRIEFAVSLVSGAAAGLVAYRYLRRGSTAPRWPAYLVAGGLPGLLLLMTEVLVRSAGHRLFSASAGTSTIDAAALAYITNGRVNHALVVFFVGALLAIIAFGRSLDRPAPAGR